MGKLVICEHCDAVYRRRALPAGAIAECERCGAELYRNRPVDLDLMLALTVSALIVLAIANAYPIVTLDMQGNESQATLWGAILSSYDTGVAFVAGLAAVTVFFFPLIQLVLYLHVLLPLRSGYPVPGFVPVMHVLRAMQPWSMVEVFMLGVLVSMVKLVGIARVLPEVGLWGFAVLTVLLTLLNQFDLHDLWDIAENRSA